MTELSTLLAQIAPLDSRAMAAAEARQGQLTKPPQALGRLESLSIRLAGITGNPYPAMARKVIAVMAGRSWRGGGRRQRLSGGSDPADGL